MLGYDDDWLEKQLRRKLEKYRLPGPKTVILPNSDRSTPDELQKLATYENIGRPILAFVGSQSQWTVLGTNGVLCCDRGSIVHKQFAAIKEVVATDMDTLPRESFEYLELKDQQGGVGKVWAPPGPELFSFWSLLKWLVELPPRKLL